MRPESIRLQLGKLVRAEMHRQGVEAVYKMGPFEGDLCTMINPLCPNDLCYLPYGHVGTDEGYHVTGTVPYDNAEKFKDFDMAPKGTSRDDLTTMGWDQARELFGEDNVR
jgi:hypothetical protein